MHLPSPCLRAWWGHRQLLEPSTSACQHQSRTVSLCLKCLPSFSHPAPLFPCQRFWPWCSVQGCLQGHPAEHTRTSSLHTGISFQAHKFNGSINALTPFTRARLIRSGTWIKVACQCCVHTGRSLQQMMAYLCSLGVQNGDHGSDDLLVLLLVILTRYNLMHVVKQTEILFRIMHG